MQAAPRLAPQPQLQQTPSMAAMLHTQVPLGHLWQGVRHPLQATQVLEP
jgi:hypothetical protein